MPLIEIRTDPQTGDSWIVCPLSQTHRRQRPEGCGNCHYYRGTENINGVEVMPGADGRWASQHFSRPSIRCAYVEHPVGAVPGQKPLLGGEKHV